MSKSDLLFLLALAAIPIQLGRHFFFDFSYVLGIPIDYRALIIYASDIAVILYLMFFFWGDRAKLKSIFKSLKTFIAVVIVFNTYLLADSLLFSVSYEASLIFVAKTIMFSLFAVASAVTLSKKGLAAKSATLFKNLILIESAILMSQFFLQKSLGLSFLGERSFDTTTPSIAHADLFGNQLLRPYGTFPHPNVAAAFLVFGLVIFWGLQNKGKLKRVFPLIIPLAGLIVTFSKSALAALAISLAIIFAKRKSFLLITFVLISFVLLFLKNTPDSSLPTISERLLLIQKSLDITLINPLFGIGSNNFILELSKANLFSVSQIRLLQPVHNIFFLILAENGIVGLLLFTALLFVVLKSINTKTKLALFVSILIFASVDHFLWTLQQGQLLLWLSLAFIISPSGVIARRRSRRSNL